MAIAPPIFFASPMDPLLYRRWALISGQKFDNRGKRVFEGRFLETSIQKIDGSPPSIPCPD